MSAAGPSTLYPPSLLSTSFQNTFFPSPEINQNKAGQQRKRKQVLSFRKDSVIFGAAKLSLICTCVLKTRSLRPGGHHCQQEGPRVGEAWAPEARSPHAPGPLPPASQVDPLVRDDIKPTCTLEVLSNALCLFLRTRDLVTQCFLPRDSFLPRRKRRIPKGPAP